jgi:hypothetical protein
MQASFMKIAVSQRSASVAAPKRLDPYLLMHAITAMSSRCVHLLNRCSAGTDRVRAAGSSSRSQRTFGPMRLPAAKRLHVCNQLSVSAGVKRAEYGLARLGRMCSSDETADGRRMRAATGSFAGSATPGLSHWFRKPLRRRRIPGRWRGSDRSGRIAFEREYITRNSSRC